MASLSEMIQYAKAKQKPDPFAQLAGIAIGGAATGFQSFQDEKKRQAEAKQKQFDNELKLIDAADKMESIKNKQYANKLILHELKAKGIVPLDQREMDIGREVAGTMLGDGKKVKTDNTTSGRMQEMFTNKSFDEYDFTLEAGPTGMSTKFTTKKGKEPRTSGQEDERAKMIYKIAQEAAQRDYMEEMSTQKDDQGYPIYQPGLSDPRKFVPPTDYVQKYLGYGEAMANAMFGDAEKELSRIRSEQRPLDLKPKKKSLWDIAAGSVGRLTGRD